MSLREDMIRAIRAQYDSADEMAGALVPAVEDTVKAYLESLRPALGDALDDPDVAALFREEIAKMAFEATLGRTEQQEESQQLLEPIGVAPAGYAYLGPDDLAIRAFCEQLVDTYLTRDEIDQLDNQQGDEMADAFISRGGYNCRHGWYALYHEDVQEFAHGNWRKANQAALNERLGGGVAR